MLMVNHPLDPWFNNMMGWIGNGDDVLASLKHVSRWELGSRRKWAEQIRSSE